MLAEGTATAFTGTPTLPDGKVPYSGRASPDQRPRTQLGRRNDSARLVAAGPARGRPYPGAVAAAGQESGEAAVGGDDVPGLCRRFVVVVTNRLQATRFRLINL